MSALTGRSAHPAGERNHNAGSSGVPLNGSLSDSIWSMYLSEAERYDKEISGGWKDDAGGVLVFTALFSATVAAFIIESYKRLSPDSGDETVLLLKQISLQLSGLRDPTSTIPPLTATPSFAPSGSIICVNVLWFLTFLISITCALAATLVQQWARQYLQPLSISVAPRERARVRSFIFLGAESYNMSGVVEMIPTLLHISVFLFLCGLVVFLFTISKPIAIVICVFTASFLYGYLLLTISSGVYTAWPYRTPFASWSWSLLLLTLHSMRDQIRFIEVVVRRVFLRVSRNPEGVQTRVPYLAELGGLVDRAITTQTLLQKMGWQKIITLQALQASAHVDAEGFKWMLETTALSNEQLQTFVAGIPGELVVHMMHPSVHRATSRGDVFSQVLHDLLNTHSASGLGDDTRSERLRTCTGAIYRGALECNVRFPPSSDHSLARHPARPLVAFVKTSALLTEYNGSDPNIRAAVLCIHALLARRTIHDLILHDGGRWPTDTNEAALLRDALPDVQLNDLASAEPALLNMVALSMLATTPESEFRGDVPVMLVDTLSILMNECISDGGNGVQEHFRMLIRKVEGDAGTGFEGSVDVLQALLLRAFPPTPPTT
ncbi:hypothetical protein BC834DRAFT_1041375 [Gloeopeniophorella convolvens]|nr:hypothetical protein BC834DRAFT_1041375 [Gloeopeniophorella convolvens]